MRNDHIVEDFLSDGIETGFREVHFIIPEVRILVFLTHVHIIKMLTIDQSQRLQDKANMIVDETLETNHPDAAALDQCLIEARLEPRASEMNRASYDPRRNLLEQRITVGVGHYRQILCLGSDQKRLQGGPDTVKALYQHCFVKNGLQ